MLTSHVNILTGSRDKGIAHESGHIGRAGQSVLTKGFTQQTLKCPVIIFDIEELENVKALTLIIGLPVRTVVHVGWQSYYLAERRDCSTTNLAG